VEEYVVKAGNLVDLKAMAVTEVLLVEDQQILPVRQEMMEMEVMAVQVVQVRDPMVEMVVYRIVVMVMRMEEEVQEVEILTVETEVLVEF
jgi:hypothetical protein